jgi:hypothetical protein
MLPAEAGGLCCGSPRTGREDRLVMGRIISWIIIILMLGLTLLFAGLDARGWSDTGTWQSAPLGQRWFELHKDSLLLLQPAIERYLFPGLWSAVQWVLERPAWLVPLVIVVVMLFLKMARRRR